ncbi:MAG: PTS sugar transporter subunit IIA [Verrucomicrobiota bacterium]|nr:PTS sugar transporter subunit IIA [Verrucomicrobiota bacterium]
MAITLNDLLEPRRIRLDLAAATKEEALRELIALLDKTEGVSQPTRFAEQVFTREKAGSTLAEHGIAFPHARTDLASEIALAIGRSSGGVPWNDAGERAHLIFVIAVPEKLAQDYLVVVGALARITKDAARRTALLAAKSAAEFIELLRSAPRL